MKFRQLIPFLALLQGLSLNLNAANIYWGGEVDGSLQTLGNWWTDLSHSSAATQIPGSTDIAIFNANAPISSQIATLGAATSLQGILFNGNSGTGITLGTLNDFILTLGSSGLSVEADAGAHTLNSSLLVNANQTWSNLSSNQLTIAGNISFANSAVQTVNINGTGDIAITGGITSTNNRTLKIGNTGNVTFGAISNTAVLTFDVASGLTPSVLGVISGSGSIHKDGPGTLILSEANTFTGTLRLMEGDVQVQKSNTANTQIIFGLASGAAGSNELGTLTLDNSSEAVNYRVGTLYVHPTSKGGIITSTGGAFDATISLNGNRTFIVNETSAEVDLLVTLGIADGDATARSLTKQSIGVMVMQGVNTYTGNTNVDRGLLVLDYSLNNGDNKLSNSNTTNLRGGHLQLSGNSSAATAEIASGLAITNGSNTLTFTSNGGQDLTLTLSGGITRSTGTGVVDIRSNDVSKTHLVVAGGSNNNAGGFLGGWATIGGTRWATRNGTNEIVALTGTTQNDKSLWAAGDNIIVSGSTSGTLVTPSISSLILDNPAGGSLTIDNNAHALTLSSAAILVSESVTADTTISGGQLLLENSTVNASNELIITNYSTGTLNVAANIGGNNTYLSSTQHLTLTGTGIIELSGRNSFTGNLYVQGNAQISGGDAINDYRNVVFASGGNMTDSGAVLNLNGHKEGIGNLSGGSNSDDTYKTLGPGEVGLGSNGQLILNQTASSTFYGIFTGTGTITKRGNATLTLSTNAHSFSGEVMVQGGSINITGGGNGLLSLNTLRLRGGSFTSTQNQTGSVNKLNNAAAVILEGTSGNGLSVSSTTNGSRSETVGTLTLAGGSNTITMDNTVTPSSTNSSALANLAIGAGNPSFSRSHSSTLLVRGINLGGTASSSTVATRVTFTNTTAINAALVGTTTSAVQTSSVTNLKILPYGVGENSISGAGNTFLTYATTLGLRPLTDTEYATNYASATSDANLSLSASDTGLADKTLNALRLVNNTGSSPVTLTGAGDLTLTSGALLFTAGATNNDVTLDGFSQILAGTSSGTPDELIVFVTSTNASPSDATLTLNTAIGDNGGATSLTKSGAGTLILGGTNTYTGSTTLNEGVLEFGQSSGNLGSGSLTLAGGTLRWADGNTTDITASSRTVELLGASVYLTPGSAGTTSTGGNILNAGSAFDTGSNNVTLTNAIGNGGYGGLTKTGTGTLTLSAAPTYTGTTMVSQGTLNFQTIAANTMEGLYLAGNKVGTTVSSTIQNGLNLQQLVVGGAYGNAGVSTTGVTGTLVVNGGAVNIGSGEGDDFILIGYRDTTAGVTTTATTGSVDFRNASSVTLNVSSLELGTFYGQISSPNSLVTRGTLLLSNTLNTITAGKIVLGNSPAAVVNSGTASLINLGTGNTTINTDTFIIGGIRSSGNVTIGSGGSFTLRGQQGGNTGANLFIGDNDITSTGTNNLSSLTLTGASAVDMKLNLLVLGRIGQANAAAGYGRGTLTYDTGSIEATTIRMADANYSTGVNNNSVNTQGTITQSGDAIFRFMDLSQGTGTATWNWQGGSLQNLANADQINHNVTISLNGTGSVTNSALRTYTVDAGQVATFEADAEFDGMGSFTKSGTGTLALKGVNTNTGNVLISAGSLSLENDGSMDDAAWFNLNTTGSLDVSNHTGASYTSDAVISGTGTLIATGGSFTVGSNVGSVSTQGVLIPGASSVTNSVSNASTVGDQTGTLTVSGNLVLATNATRVDRAYLQAGATDRNAAATFAGDLTTWVDNIPTNHSAYMTGAGANQDLLSVSGGLTLNANGGISITAYDGYQGNFGDVFNFLDWSTLVGLTDNGFNVGPRYQDGSETIYDLQLFTLQPGLQWDTSLFLNNGVLVVVPEPSRLLLLGFALGALALRRRRQGQM